LCKLNVFQCYAVGIKAAFLGEFTSKPNNRQQLWEFSMETARRPLRRAFLVLPLVLSMLAPAFAAEKSRVQAKDYVIDAEIVPKPPRLSAKVKVTFQAQDDANFASFELHNALHVTKVLDANGKPLTAERVSQDNAVRVAFPTAIPKGTTST